MSIDKKIFNERLYFRKKAVPKVNSFENVDHQARVSDKQIYNEFLPWLRYNKPNLPERVKEQINHKQYSLEQYNNHSSNSSENEQENHKNLYFPKVNDEKNENKRSEIFKYKSKIVNKENYDNVVNSESKDKRTSVSTNVSKDNNSSENNFIQPRNTNPRNNIIGKSKKKLKDQIINLQLKKCDASTETETVNSTSVEVQTIEMVRNQNAKKLHKALKNSNTLEKSYSLIPRKIKYFQLSKPSDNVSEPIEEIITTRFIETFLPSISNTEVENKMKQNKSYSYMNNHKLNNFKAAEFSPGKRLVTHAGMDFLDQYWASQRWLKLNKTSNVSQRASSDSFIFESNTGSKPEIPVLVSMGGLKKIDQKEKFTFRDLFNERIQYYTDQGDHSIYKPNSQIEKIDSKDLKNIVH